MKDEPKVTWAADVINMKEKVFPRAAFVLKKENDRPEYVD